MGTSLSSSGSPSGTPMVPPWVQSPVPPDDDDSGDADVASSQPAPIAPPGRFRGARLRLGRFADTGSAGDMKKGVAHYVHKGLGGSSMAARRLGSTVHTAGTLFDALSGVFNKELDTDVLSGRSVDEIMSTIIEVVCLVDGTLDSESSRDSIKRSLSELLRRFPDADLLNLSREQRILAVEHYIARDVFNRFYLDLGKTIQEKAPNLVSGMSRVEDAKEYIMETVAAAFRKLVNDVSAFSGRKIREIAHESLEMSISVFEENL